MTTVAFLLLLMGACASNEPQFIATEFSDNSPLQVFLLDPFEEPIGHSMVLSDAKEKTLQRFGEPQKVDIVSKPDRYADGDVTHSTLHYAGLVIEIAEYSGQSHSWLNRIEITGEQYQLKYDLRIGASHQDVLDSLQPSSYSDTPSLLKMHEDIWERRFGDSPEDDVQVGSSAQLMFEFDATDRVSKIMWIRLGH